MSKKLGSMTLMFVDLPTVVVTRELDGDAIARDMVQECFALIGAVRSKYGGKQVRTVGNSVICRFESPDDALMASRDMHAAVKCKSFMTTKRPYIRIGLHRGEAAFREGNCVGEAVTTTARVVALSSPGQTLATQPFCLGLSSEANQFAARLRTAEMLERRLGFKLFEIAWNHDAHLEQAQHAEEAQEAQLVAAAATQYAAANTAADLPPAQPQAPVDPSTPDLNDPGLTLTSMPALELNSGNDSLDLDPNPKELQVARPWRLSSAAQKKLNRPKKKKKLEDGSPAPQTVRLVMKRKPARRKNIVLKEVVEEATDPSACVDQALLAPPPPAAAPPAAEQATDAVLCVIWGAGVFQVSAGQPILKLGRQEKNDIVLQGDTASRLHGYIEFRQGQFFMVDHSWNGTFVYDQTGGEQYLKNDEARLDPSGAVCPGCPEEGEACESVLFWRADT